MTAMPAVSDLLVHIDVDDDTVEEDRLEIANLPRHVSDFEMDIRRVAARFPAFSEIRSVTLHMPDARRVKAALRVRWTNSVLIGFRILYVSWSCLHLQVKH